MNRQDDFPPAVRELLAKRAGYRCSFLGCGSPTYGPSDETKYSVSGIGMGCHISAASGGPGSKRFDPAMTSMERKSIENGIWMCYIHGKLIDTDELRFSSDILKKWKDVAENVARIMVERNCEYNEALSHYYFSDLIPNDINLTGIGKENVIVGNALADSAVNVSWGDKTAVIVRDFLIEHIRNAFQHGHAKEVQLEISTNKILITDDGNEFNVKTLIDRNEISGCTMAIKEILSESNVLVAARRNEGKNRTSVVLVRYFSDVYAFHPCIHTITFEEYKSAEVDIKIDKSCDEIYIVLPPYFTISDAIKLTRERIQLVYDSRPITFFTHILSDTSLSLIEKNYPGCRIVWLHGPKVNR